MKSLKSKVIASAAMLLVAAVMMTSSSFAWYTISQQGELEEVKVKMDATDNLEIAKAIDKGTTTPSEVDTEQTGKEQFYGSEITATTEHVLDLPATVTTGAVQTPVYASDGRLGSLQNATPSSMEGDTSKSDFGYYYYNVTDTEKCAVVYGFWLRSNEYTQATLEVTQPDGAKVTAVIRDKAGTTTYANGATNVPVSDGGIYYELLLYYEGAGNNGVKAADVEDGLAQETVTLKFTPTQGS